MQDLAQLHSVYLCKTAELESFEWLDKRTEENNSEMSLLWTELLIHAHSEFPEIWSAQRYVEFVSLCLSFIYCYIQLRVQIVENAIINMDKINSVLATAPLTLIHNDCNPRNMCLRKSMQQTPRICLYDWELAMIDVPQRDLAEFLAFTLEPSSPMATRVELINFYRSCLERFSGMKYPMGR